VHQKDKSEIPVGMEKVRRRLERWRKTRRGRAPLPGRLWAAAANLAREHGVNRTSRALGLEFNKLKALARKKKAEKKEAQTPHFLELMAPNFAGGMNDCVIELTGSSGRMRIEWKGSGAPDLAGLCRVLWERK